MSNEAQNEFWNGPAADVWVEAQAYMDQMLEPLSRLAVAKAALGADERAIDVGCGCGGTSLALAESGGAVWGLDISAAMVARAKERAKDTPVAFSIGDAATQTYTPDHHLVFSRFGVMFFDDPKAAFGNLRSALVPGGRLVFICWQPPKENLWMSVAGRAIAPFLPEAEAQDPRAPGPFAFADPNWVREILVEAGFAGIEIESITPDLRVGSTVEEAIQLQRRIGPLSRAMAELDEATQVQANEAAHAALSEYLTDDGVVLRSAAWLVSAGNAA
jgi:SAM-dependent methyltransferase